MIKLKTLTNDPQKNGEQTNERENGYQISFPLLGQKGECKYQNLVHIQNSRISSTDGDKIKIINKLCTDSGDALEKITSIKFNNQLITIRDFYTFESLGLKPIDNPTSRRVQIFKKPLLQNLDQGANCTRLTKNLPKNFIKAFLNYLQGVKNAKNQQLLDCKIKLLVNRQKYNNSFIQRIVDDQELYPYFRDFLLNHAADWIQNSKITNKDVHLQAVNVFLALQPSSKKKKGYQIVESTNSSGTDEQKQQYMNNEIESQSREMLSDRQSIMANSSKS